VKAEPRSHAHFITVKEAAKALALSQRSIHRLIDQGDLRKHQFGRAVRIAPDDLEAYIARSRK
jgi:excisionase family DNA binding protein